MKLLYPSSKSKVKLLYPSSKSKVKSFTNQGAATDPHHFLLEVKRLRPFWLKIKGVERT